MNTTAEETRTEVQDKDEIRATACALAHTGETAILDTKVWEGTRQIHVRGVAVGRVIGVSATTVALATSDRTLVIVLSAITKIAKLERGERP